MPPSVPGRQRPDYSIDAPGVVRNLFLVAALGAVALAVRGSGLASDRFPVGLVCDPLIGTGAGCLFVGVAMLWTSKFGKVHERERLLAALPWRGDETVLDIGCGRGLMLLGAARRLTTGTAVGVDLWQQEDLSGNRPEATLENARREGVADRVEIRNGDARRLPFPKASFDVVLACNSLHNIYDTAERCQALREAARVLRPGGRVAILDLRHTGEYARVLREAGLEDVRRAAYPTTWLWTALTFGSVRPYRVTGRKPAAPPGTA